MSFDRDVALRRAMLMFWRHGYESTSVSDLTAAMEVTPPSLYAAFGDKKRLFLAAVDLYLSGPSDPLAIIDQAASARDAACALIDGAVIAFTGEHTPPGCMLATSAISCSAASADVQSALAAIRNRVEAHLENRIRRGIASGELPADTASEALAGHVTAVIQGMSTLARDGASREKLQRVAAMAMTVWPLPDPAADCSSDSRNRGFQRGIPEGLPTIGKHLLPVCKHLFTCEPPTHSVIPVLVTGIQPHRVRGARRESPDPTDVGSLDSCDEAQE